MTSLTVSREEKHSTGRNLTLHHVNERSSTSCHQCQSCTHNVWHFINIFVLGFLNRFCYSRFCTIVRSSLDYVKTCLDRNVKVQKFAKDRFTITIECSCIMQDYIDLQKCASFLLSFSIDYCWYCLYSKKWPC